MGKMARARKTWKIDRLVRERALWERGVRLVAGVDEAGVGPLAGPVVAAAVLFRTGEFVEGVNDSKQIAPARRLVLAEQIRSEALAWSVVHVQPEEIDQINIYQATLIAMRRAVEGLNARPDHVLVDARTIPGIGMTQEGIVKGDALCHVIGAASILAKTDRDLLMEEMDSRYPGYGFAGHKGYPTEAHRDAIRKQGPCPIHRRSFRLLPERRLF
jgi:ribonuclease HII